MLIIAHVSLMITAALCLCAGIGFAMFGRKKKFWLKWHKKLNATGFGLLVAGEVMAFANVATSGGNHLEGIHPWAGLAAFILSNITLFLIFYALKAADKTTARTMHKWSGRASLLAIGIAMVLGFIMIGVL
jgi:hypothetical protein